MGEKTRIHRLPEREVTDRQQINEILDEGFVCHAAYVIENRPVVIPTLYVRKDDQLLLHGSNSSGLVKAVRDGSPLSVGVTHIDGLVVARSGFHSWPTIAVSWSTGRGAFSPARTTRRPLT